MNSYLSDGLIMDQTGLLEMSVGGEQTVLQRNSKRAGWLATTAAMAVIAFAGAAMAQEDADPQATAPPAPVRPSDPRDAQIFDLQQRLDAQQALIDDMRDQLGDLKSSVSSNIKDVRDTAANADRAVIVGGKPSIQSADGRFTANLKGVMQLDAAAYFQDNVTAAQTDTHARDLNDGVNFRRARIGIDGKLFGDFNYSILYDFGGTGAEDAGKIQELWVEYAGFKPLKVRVGAFAPNVGLADATSTNGMLFLERPAPAEIARTVAGGDRRVGLQVQGTGETWLVAGAVTGPTISSLNSTASGFNAQNFDEQLGYTGRVAWTPIKGEDWRAHLGLNGSVVTQVGDTGPASAVRYPFQLRDRPELTVDGTRLIDTGAIDAEGARQFGLEAGFQKANFLVEAEYFDVEIKRRNSTFSDPSFTGYYVQGSWVITGEPRAWSQDTATWGAPKVGKNFNPKAGEWGALEVAGRYSVADLDDNEGNEGLATPAGGIRGGRQEVVSVGVNWYLNPIVRLMVDYQHVDIDRLRANGQQIGQDYDALSARAQLAF
jgi:phosphate-selective porin OprO/OprP